MSYGIADALFPVNTSALLGNVKVARVHSSLRDDDAEEELIRKRLTRTERDRQARKRQDEIYERMKLRGVARVLFADMQDWDNDGNAKRLLRDLAELRRTGRVGFTMERGRGYYWARENL